MAAIPEPSITITSLIDKAHEERARPPRQHLGCSELGHHCDRWLWLSFRWAARENFSGRMLRLFRRGQNEEDVIISDLRAIGIDVRGTQERVDFGKHVSGSIDGIIYYGVPGAEKKKHIAEFKTHSLKSFNALEKAGVEVHKPQHFTQMQLYMHGLKIDRALYIAVCKDDDRIYTERVKYDAALAERLVLKGHAITQADRMPPPISTDPSWFQCKFCPAYDMCHQSKPTRFANCRTCAHMTVNDGFHCERWNADVPAEAQEAGCDEHVIHPDLVPWPMEGSEDGHSVAWTIGGRRVVNGPGGYKSREILANPEACGGATAEAIRNAFPGAEVVG